VKKIELTRGMHAIIDDDDYALVSKFKWYAHVCGGQTNHRKYYAKRRVYTSGRNSFIMSMESFLIGKIQGMVIDHIDGDSLNNSRSNLRHCTQAENLRNIKKPGIKGVCFRKNSKRYAARIGVFGKTIQIGTFDSKIEAARAYDAAAVSLYGEFASTNNV
jgi:hypothetical protein